MAFMKSVKSQIAEVRKAVQLGKEAGLDADYQQIRSNFNIQVIGVLIGAGFEKNDEGNWVTTGWSFLPNKNEFIEILGLIDEYIASVESRFINGTDDGDMKIINPQKRNVPFLEEVTNDKFKKVVIEGISKYLTKDDFIRLADMAEKLRKHNFKTFGLWAVGITLVLVAGAGAYMFIEAKKKSEEKKGDDNSSDTNEYDDVGSDVVITVDDDTPVVIVPDDATEITIDG